MHLSKRRVEREFVPWLNQSIRNQATERGLAKRADEKSPEKWSVCKQLRDEVAKEIKVAVQFQVQPEKYVADHEHNVR